MLRENTVNQSEVQASTVKLAINHVQIHVAKPKLIWSGFHLVENAARVFSMVTKHEAKPKKT